MPQVDFSTLKGMLADWFTSNRGFLTVEFPAALKKKDAQDYADYTAALNGFSTIILNAPEMKKISEADSIALLNVLERFSYHLACNTQERAPLKELLGKDMMVVLRHFFQNDMPSLQANLKSFWDSSAIPVSETIKALVPPSRILHNMSDNPVIRAFKNQRSPGNNNMHRLLSLILTRCTEYTNCYPEGRFHEDLRFISHSPRLSPHEDYPEAVREIEQGRQAMTLLYEALHNTIEALSSEHLPLEMTDTVLRQCKADLVSLDSVIERFDEQMDPVLQAMHTIFKLEETHSLLHHKQLSAQRRIS